MRIDRFGKEDDEMRVEKIAKEEDEGKRKRPRQLSKFLPGFARLSISHSCIINLGFASGQALHQET